MASTSQAVAVRDPRNPATQSGWRQTILLLVFDFALFIWEIFMRIKAAALRKHEHRASEIARRVFDLLAS